MWGGGALRSTTGSEGDRLHTRIVSAGTRLADSLPDGGEKRPRGVSVLIRSGSIDGVPRLARTHAQH